MSDHDDRTMALLKRIESGQTRLDARSIETLQRVTRIEVEVRQAHADVIATGVRVEALQARVDALEAERDERRGELQAARQTGIGGAVLGGIGVLASLARAVWDAAAGTHGP